MHGLPKGKRKVFRRENLIQQLVLGSVIVACFVYVFGFTDNFILKLIAGIALAIVAMVIFSYYMIEFFTGRGYTIASAFNEAMYLVLGIPILVIAAGFLPASIYISFFAGDNTTYVRVGLYVVIGIIEIFAILFLVNRYLRDRQMNIIQYLKYIFDFKARAEEQRKFQDRADQIDDFYDGLHKVSDKLAKKMEERAMGFKEFDFRERTGQLGLRKTTEVKCWNCQATNEKDSLFCSTCSTPLKKE